MFLAPYIALVALSVFLCFIAVYNWRRRKLYRAARKFNGPPALPILGNAGKFMFKTEDDMLKEFFNITKESSLEPMRLWLGPTLLIMFLSPDHVEKILASSKMTQKHDIYDFVKVFFGEGLVTGSGPKHKPHRKLIQPMFDLTFAQETVPIFQKHIDLCMAKFEQHVDQGVFNADGIIHKCIIDVSKEIIFGLKERSQISGMSEFDEAMIDLHHFGRIRGSNPYLHPNIIFNMTQYKKKQDKLEIIIRGKGESIVKDSFKRRQQKMSCAFHPIVDQIVDYMDKNPGVFTEEELIDHIITLYAATEDPVYTIASCLVMCLGMYPEYQERAAQEIRDIFGETPRPVTMDDISKLQYVNMCLKDTIRLFPTAAMILRKCNEDFQLDKWLIPKDCAIALPICVMHKDKRFWENPDHFYPDHFLPENKNKRHSSAYIPFSAGPRGCIGKILANTGVKIFICKFLQRFEVEIDEKIPDLELKMDVSVRPKRGYMLSLKRRVWK